MKIDSYTLTQESTLYKSAQFKQTAINAILSGDTVDKMLSQGAELAKSEPDNEGAGENTANAAKDLARDMNVAPARLGSAIQQANKDLRIALLEAFFGRLGFRFRDAGDELQKRVDDALRRQNDLMQQMTVNALGVSRRNPDNRMTGNGRTVRMMQVVSTELSMEQSMSYSVSGSIKTSDGRTIGMQMELNMSSSFYAKNTTMIEGAFCDPLVVNFNAPAAALQGTKFSFDIDSDGESDQISRLAEGSGFLALDKNGDGTINDGSELFGTKSGDGFADLTVYDKDKNGWIDENDEIFDKLRIWSTDESGHQKLMALGEVGIGAIYLGSQQTNYALGSLNNPDAMIRANGFFLREDGTSGTMQQVDFRV